MKKSERLNMELIFLKDKSSFHLKDLMVEFNISKSTAIRDIKALEEMGLALYVENGRFGGYKIISENLLTPIYFNNNEMLAIFYALKSMSALTTTPFEKTYVQLSEKLSATISPNLRNEITETLNYIHFHTVSPVKKTKYLATILEVIQSNDVVMIHYSQYEPIIYERIQIYELFYRSGVWFFSGMDLIRGQWGIYRCDYVDMLEKVEDNLAKYTRSQLSDLEIDYEQNYHDINFKCELTAFGVELFLKKSYPNMSLEYIEDKPFIVGGYNEGELQYMIDYLISLGENVKILYPESLKINYMTKLKAILNQYQK